MNLLETRYFMRDSDTRPFIRYNIEDNPDFAEEVIGGSFEAVGFEFEWKRQSQEIEKVIHYGDMYSEFGNGFSFFINGWEAITFQFQLSAKGDIIILNVYLNDAFIAFPDAPTYNELASITDNEVKYFPLLGNNFAIKFEQEGHVLHNRVLYFYISRPYTTNKLQLHISGSIPNLYVTRLGDERNIHYIYYGSEGVMLYLKFTLAGADKDLIKFNYFIPRNPTYEEITFEI